MSNLNRTHSTNKIESAAICHVFSLLLQYFQIIIHDATNLASSDSNTFNLTQSLPFSGAAEVVDVVAHKTVELCLHTTAWARITPDVPVGFFPELERYFDLLLIFVHAPFQLTITFFSVTSNSWGLLLQGNVGVLN